MYQCLGRALRTERHSDQSHKSLEVHRLLSVVVLAVAGCPQAIFFVVVGMAGDLLVGVDLLDVVEGWFRGRG